MGKKIKARGEKGYFFSLDYYICQNPCCWPISADLVSWRRLPGNQGKRTTSFIFAKTFLILTENGGKGSFYCKVQKHQRKYSLTKEIFKWISFIARYKNYWYISDISQQEVTSSSGDDVSTANGRSLKEEHLYQRTITYIGHIEYKRQSSVLRTPASAQKITIIYILASHNVNVNRPWSWPPHTNKSRLGQWDTGLCIIHLLSYLLSNNIQVTKMFVSLEASSKLKWLSQQLNKK